MNSIVDFNSYFEDQKKAKPKFEAARVPVTAPQFVKPPEFNENSSDDEKLGMLLIAALPTLLGGVLGGKTGARAGAQAGEYGVKTYLNDKKETAKNKADTRRQRFMDEATLLTKGIKTEGATPGDPYSGRPVRDPEFQDENRQLTRAKIKQIQGEASKINSQMIESQAAKGLVPGKNEAGEIIYDSNGFISTWQFSDSALEEMALNKQKTEAQIDLDKSKAELNRAKAKKEKSSGSGYSIPGLIHDGKTNLDKTSLRKAREAATQVKPLLRNIETARNMIAKTDRKDWLEPAFRKKIMGYLRDAQLVYKSEAFANLGVLTGPDLQLLEDVIINPYSMTGLYMGGEDIAREYDRAIDRIKMRARDFYAPYGFSPEPLFNTGMDQAPAQQRRNVQPQAAPKDGETRTWKGKTYKKIGNNWVEQ